MSRAFHLVLDLWVICRQRERKHGYFGHKNDYRTIFAIPDYRVVGAVLPVFSGEVLIKKRPGCLSETAGPEGKIIGL